MRKFYDKFFKFDIFSGTISGTGVMLTAHGNADKPYLKLSVDDHSYDEVITAVDVLCNAR